MASPPGPQRRRSAPFRPSFTLMLLYLALFFVAFCFAVALPSLIEAARQLPPGDAPPTPEDLERASRITQSALQGKVLWIFLAALAATALGAWRGMLPGLRPPTP